MVMNRSCGECTLCCKLFDINKPEEGLVKPGNVWCQHCTPGKGCGIYEARPPVCVDFACAWLTLDWLPESLRPDRSKVIFQDTGTRLGITCTLDNPVAHKGVLVMKVLNAITDTQGFCAVIYKGDIHRMFVREGAGKVARMSFPDYMRLSRAKRLPKGVPNFIVHSSGGLVVEGDTFGEARKD